MINVKWKGKIGYGDIISPICYAHNVAHKLDEPVNLTFYWERGPTHKVHPSDPETLHYRANFIAEMCEPGDVIVRHIFHKPMKENHTNYEWDFVGDDKFHNYWYPTVTNTPKTNTIVVNPTFNNIQTLSDYGKSWKDILEGKWEYVVKRLSEKYNVVCVDYRTPIAEMMELMLTARGFVGYHGTAAWPAKFFHVPSVLFADGGSLTSKAFPYATVFRSADELDTVIDNIEQYLVQSSNLIEQCKQQYIQYEPRFEGFLVYE